MSIPNLVLLLFSWMTILISTSNADWKKSLGLGTEKVSHLHFYYHDTLSGKNPTAEKVAQASDTNKSSTQFGVVFIFDDPLTEGPDPSSKLVGRAQGLYAATGQKSMSLIMAMNFGFIQGVYNGSTITILGQNRIFDLTREMPVIGGSGIFRLARGFATAKTYVFNQTSGDAIVEYHVTVVHY